MSFSFYTLKFVVFVCGMFSLPFFFTGFPFGREPEYQLPFSSVDCP